MKAARVNSWNNTFKKHGIKIANTYANLIFKFALRFVQFVVVSHLTQTIDIYFSGSVIRKDSFSLPKGRHSFYFTRKFKTEISVITLFEKRSLAFCQILFFSGFPCLFVAKIVFLALVSLKFESHKFLEHLNISESYILHLTIQLESKCDLFW